MFSILQSCSLPEMITMADVFASPPLAMWSWNELSTGFQAVLIGVAVAVGTALVVATVVAVVIATAPAIAVAAVAVTVGVIAGCVAGGVYAYNNGGGGGNGPAGQTPSAATAQNTAPIPPIAEPTPTPPLPKKFTWEIRRKPNDSGGYDFEVTAFEDRRRVEEYSFSVDEQAMDSKLKEAWPSWVNERADKEPDAKMEIFLVKPDFDEETITRIRKIITAANEKTDVPIQFGAVSALSPRLTKKEEVVKDSSSAPAGEE